MKAKLLAQMNLEQYGLLPENITSLDERTVVVKKWNWEYEKAWAFQKASVQLLQEIPQMRILICCNHPQVLTNGRGLQKPRKGEVLQLVDFDIKSYSSLPFPLFQIERGGGLTFHHPGQFIFYPIVKLNPQTLSLSKMVDDIFDFSIDVLSSWGAKDLTHSNKLLGLWYGNRKMASMGIAIEKLTTFHGMALNLTRDGEMMNALKIMNPCGLTSETYISTEEVISLPENFLNKFADEFLQKVQHGWK